MKTVSTFIAVSTAFSAFLVSPLAMAKCDSAGFTIPKQVMLEGYNQPTLLNGFGIRTKLVWDIYVGSLYLPKKTSEANRALTMQGPRRISIYFAHDVPKEKLIEGWQDGFINNNSDDQLNSLQARLTESYKYLTDMKVGDHIDIDSHPEKGSLLWINGKLRHSIPGDDYFNAVLKIWLGDKPAQGPLKRCMLGIPEREES